MLSTFSFTGLARLLILGLIILELGCTDNLKVNAKTQDFSVVLHVSLNTKTEIATVDNGFLSFTTETGKFMKRKIPYHSGFDPKKRRRFLILCSGLSLQDGGAFFPAAHWRIGGRKSSELVYKDKNEEDGRNREKNNREDDNNGRSKDENNKLRGRFNPEEFSFTTNDWDQLHLYARKLNWTVNFAINGLLRKSDDGSWNSSNAEKLMKYTSLKGYSVNYDLGKAPNQYARYFNVTITPDQLAKDFSALKSLSRKYNPKAKIIGPDIAKNNIGSYFRTCNGKKHQTSLESCMDAGHLDGFLKQAPVARAVIRNTTGTKTTPILIGEAADTYGSGVDGVSNTFAAGFLMLDKLGMAARMNFQAFFRRELIGRPSALMDDELNHRPVYWMSVLYKLLVGKRVLDVKGSLQPGRTLRIYAHCVNEFGRHHYYKGAVVLIALNLDVNNSARFLLDRQLAGLNADEYLLQAPGGDVSSKKVLLNGVELDLISDTQLPPLKPKLQISQPFFIPAKSYGFFVLTEAQSEACLK
eukprot:gene15224-16798_t